MVQIYGQVNRMEETMGEKDWGVSATVSGSQFFNFLFFKFLFRFNFCLYPSSLIRCDLESCTLFEVLDCACICPWPGDCNQRESRVVALEN